MAKITALKPPRSSRISPHKKKVFFGWRADAGVEYRLEPYDRIVFGDVREFHRLQFGGNACQTRDVLGSQNKLNTSLERFQGDMTGLPQTSTIGVQEYVRL
jgi:hypothetical protein